MHNFPKVPPHTHI